MVTVAELADATAQLLGLTIIVAAIAAAAAFVYRWYVRERLPDGLAVLIGLSVVAVSIGTTGWLNQVIGGSDTLISAGAALRNIGVFVICAGGAYAGARVGHRVSRDVAAATGSTVIDAEISTLVEAVGRVITVELPEEIDDVVGYDPVAPATKEALEGKTFLFPRRLTVAELRERLVARLRTDYAVGHVDVELGADGTVEYLALGSRAAGIGPTLPPETAAVAIRADPAYAASAGDLVQVWETNPSRRVLTAELRGAADDVVTLAIDAADTPKLDQETRYRLVTLPVDDRPDREFASLLRAADETLATVKIGANSAVAGSPVADLGVTVVAVTGPEGETTTLPSGDRAVAPGEVLYAIGPPETLRKLEDAAAAGDSAGHGDHQVDPLPPEATAEPEPPASADSAAEQSGDGSELVESVSSVAEGSDEPIEAWSDEAPDSTSDETPAVEPVSEDHTPVFKPESGRDPLVDAAPDDVEGDERSSEGDESDGKRTDGDGARTGLDTQDGTGETDTATGDPSVDDDERT